MDIKSKLKNSLEYEGRVTVTLKNNGNTHKLCVLNSGTQALMSFLANCIAGTYSKGNSTYTIPSKLDFQILYPTGWISLLQSTVYLTGVVVKDSTDSNVIESSTIWNAFITPSNIKTGFTVNNTSTARLVLCDNNIPTTDFAYVVEDNAENLSTLYAALTSGQDAVIDWNMYFRNKTATTVEEDETE